MMGHVGDIRLVQRVLTESSTIIQETTTNITDLEYEREICEMHSARKVTIAEMIACIIALLTVLENCIILIAILRGHRSLRERPYWFIASLAVADLFTGFEVVLAVFVRVGDSPLSRIALKGAAVVTFIASINSLLLVSLDRYIRIVYHTEYRRFLNRKTVVGLIVGSWTFSIIVFLVAPLLNWSCSYSHCCGHDGLCTCMRSKYGDDVCGRECSQSFVPFTKNYLRVGVIYFAISVVVMTTFYGIIFKVVKEKTFSKGDSKSKRRDIKLAKTLVITLGIFVLCWLPVQVLFIIDLVVDQRNEIISKAFDYALVPSVINSFMNPIIYSVRLPHMRTSIQRIFLPCLYGDSLTNGSTWNSSTSGERGKSFRRLSGKRRKGTRHTEKTKASKSSSSETKSHTPPITARDRLVSGKSMTSENSVSNSKE